LETAEIKVSNSERRLYPRMPLAITVKYTSLRDGKMQNIFESLSEDLGAHGLSIRSTEEIARGQKLLISLFLPCKIKRRRKSAHRRRKRYWSIFILSSVAWCRTLGKNQYRVGLQFLNVDGSSRKPFKQFLDEFYLDPDNRAIKRRPPRAGTRA